MKIYRLLIVALGVVLLDQFTKELVQNVLNYGRQMTVVPGFFDITLTYNKGVAFGMMSGLSDFNRNLAVYFSTMFALLVLGILFFKYYAYSVSHTTAVALILGGAVGNLIDRIRLGQVVDFLDFHIVNYHWPAFNIADSGICIGVFILLILKD